jgi:hypothetical protein
MICFESHEDIQGNIHVRILKECLQNDSSIAPKHGTDAIIYESSLKARNLKVNYRCVMYVHMVMH